MYPVQRFPKTRVLSEEDLSGHVWAQELITGEPLRFRVASSGFVEFGTRGEVFGTDVPVQFRTAARCVREELGLSALRGSVGDTESVTFFGIATLYEGLGYDWSELPAFVGVDIWSDERDEYLTPDAASSAYSSLGLTPLPAFEKETDAERAPIETYTSGDLPESRFRDGPAAGVLVRDKSGGRGEVRRSFSDDELSAEEASDLYVTKERIDAVDSMTDENLDEVIERVTETVAREEYARLYEGKSVVSETELRSAVAEKVRRRLP